MRRAVASRIRAQVKAWEAAGATIAGRPRGRPRLSKYRSVKTLVDGFRFDSRKEAAEYGRLKLLERAGQIFNLELQPVYELHVPSGEVLGCYRGDFRYRDQDGTVRHIDVKGMKTLPLARWKQRHVKAEYGITIQEVR
jgi:uncharacterized protein DUF1064